MTTPTLSFAQRLWLCWVAFFRVLFDGQAATRVQYALSGKPVEPPVQKIAAAVSEVEAPHAAARPVNAHVPEQTELVPSAEAGALLLLGLFQREGRLVDFLQQDITSFGDLEVAGAVRVVHEGCRKVLLRQTTLKSLRPEAEGTQVDVPSGFDAQALKLTGNVVGSGPFRGVLRHHGWRAERIELPRVLARHEASVIAPAEVEIL